MRDDGTRCGECDAECSLRRHRDLQRALTASPARLEAVAAQSGSASAEVVRRVFLRLLGNTPSDYRVRFAEREPAP